MDDLVQWFGEQLTEDERRQRSTFRSTWRYGDPCTECERPAEVMRLMGPDLPCAKFLPCGHEVYDPSHLERYQESAADAGTLRDIEAKRAVLDAFAEGAANEVELDDAFEYAGGWANGLGFAVRHLAAAYSDRPGYREEWRP